MKLLDRSLRRMSLYAVAVLLLSVPGYYLMVQALWMGSVDKGLAMRRDALEAMFAHAGNDADDAARTALRMQPGLALTPAPAGASPADRFHSELHPDRPGGEEEQYRVLTGTLLLNGVPWQVTLEEQVEETDEVVGALVAVTALFLVVLLAGFLWLNRRLARQVWRPFQDMLAALRTFELSAQHALVLPPSDIAEFTELNTTLTHLADRAVAAYREQKEFTDNAAHEMQTPLALLHSRMDLLLQSPELTATQAGLVEGAKRTVDRLARLNKDLLLLSRIENGQWPAEKPMDLSALVRQITATVAEQAALQDIRLVEEVRSDMHLSMHPTLATSLLNNLLWNALHHNHAGGRILVTLEQGRFTVANTGAPSPLDQARLFQRFRTFDPQHKGHGLGLSITKRIADVHGLSLVYAYRDGNHAFELSF